MQLSNIRQALVAWTLTFTITSQFVHHIVLHNVCLPAALLTGAVVALWVALPMVMPWQIERYNQLDPVPKRYVIERGQALERVGSALRDCGWEVSPRDQNRIHAWLQETTHTTHTTQPTQPTQPTQSTQSAPYNQAMFSLDAKVEQSENSVVVHLHTRVAGKALDYWEHTSILDSAYATIDRALGVGSDITNFAIYTIKAPPWWLLIVTGITLVIFAKIALS